MHHVIPYEPDLIEIFNERGLVDSEADPLPPIRIFKEPNVFTEGKIRDSTAARMGDMVVALLQTT